MIISKMKIKQISLQRAKSRRKPTKMQFTTLKKINQTIFKHFLKITIKYSLLSMEMGKIYFIFSQGLVNLLKSSTFVTISTI